MEPHNIKQQLQNTAKIAHNVTPSNDYLNSTSNLIENLMISGNKKIYLIYMGKVFAEFYTMSEAQQYMATVPLVFTILDLTGINID